MSTKEVLMKDDDDSQSLIQDRSFSSDENFDMNSSDEDFGMSDEDDDFHPNSMYRKRKQKEIKSNQKEINSNQTLSNDFNTTPLNGFNITLDDDGLASPTTMASMNSTGFHYNRFPITDDLGNCFLLRNIKVPKKYKSTLKSLKVEIDWKLPAYQKHKKIYKDDRESNPEEINSNKIGHYAPSEDAIIMKNWEEFCSKYRLEGIHISCVLYCKMLKTGTKNDILRFLARNINRTLESVEKRLILILASQHPRKYSFLEIEVIRNYYFSKCRGAYGQQFRLDLEFILSRFGFAYRAHTLPRAKSDHYFHKIDSKLITTLINRLISYLEDNPNTHKDRFCRIRWHYILNNTHKNKKPIETDVTLLTLKTFWIYQLSTQILQTEPLYLNHLLVKLIRILYKRNYNHWVSIRWKSIAEEFDKIRPELLCYQFMIYVVSHVPKLLYLNYKETIQILYCYFIPELISSPGKLLPVIPLKVKERNLFIELWHRHLEYHKNEK